MEMELKELAKTVAPSPSDSRDSTIQNFSWPLRLPVSSAMQEHHQYIQDASINTTTTRISDI